MKVVQHKVVNPLSNITDGNTSNLWIVANEVYPSSANVNLGKDYFAENIEVVFEKTGLPFQFKVETVDSEGNTSLVLDKSNNNEVLDKSYTIEVKDNIKSDIVIFR